MTYQEIQKEIFKLESIDSRPVYYYSSEKARYLFLNKVPAKDLTLAKWEFAAKKKWLFFCKHKVRYMGDACGMCFEATDCSMCLLRKVSINGRPCVDPNFPLTTYLALKRVFKKWNIKK